MENKILATVSGTPITDAEVSAFLRGMGQQGQAYNNPEGRKAILQELVAQKLLLLDAQKNLLEAEPAFKEQLKKAKESLLANYALEKVITGVRITDKEIEDYYNENQDKFVSPATVNASHILVDSEEKAKEIYAKIEKGEMSFEDAAKEYSSCPSKDNGGSLGDFGKGQMVPEFDAAVFAMEVGEVTKEPVQTQFGYHLIRLNSKKEGETMPLDSIKERLGQQLLGQKQQKAYESRINQLKILYPVDIAL
jgi:peptidyl-prolyl cis-trans isomerase C